MHQFNTTPKVGHWCTGIVLGPESFPSDKEFEAVVTSLLF